MYSQHLFVLIIDLVIANQEIAPEAATHKLKDILALFILQLV